MRAALWLVALLAVPSLARAEVLTATYSCERGVEIPATYVNAGEDAVVVFQVEGRQITLHLTPAASGARYAWPADGSGYVWWTKGEAATLAWFDAEHSEEVMLYAECRAR